MHHNLAWPSLISVIVLVVGFVAKSPSEKNETNAKRAYPPGELGKVVKLGEDIVDHTPEHPLSKKFVGNKLNCTFCHLDSGQHETAGSFLGTAAAYPAWSPREERSITLKDRVLNCFMRSENGP